MSMVVRTNINSMNANRNLSINNNQVAKSIQKLASGYAINSAADDSSGLAITEKMRAQITGLDQGTDNALDGVCLVQTAEGGMNEIHNMLNRMTELATKSANGTIQDEVDREAIQAEVDVLVDEIDRIAKSTNYNGIPLLDGSLAGVGGAGGTGGNLDFWGDDRVEYYDLGMSNGIGEEITGIDFTGLKGSDLVGSSMIIDYMHIITLVQPPWEYNYEITINFTDDITNADIINDGYWVEVGKNTGLNEVEKIELTMYLEPDKDATETIKSIAISEQANYYGSKVIFLENSNYNFPNSKDFNNNTNNGYIIDKYADYTTEYSEITNFRIEKPYSGDSDINNNPYETALILHVADQNKDYNKITVSIDSMRATELGVDPLDVSNQDAAALAIDKIKAAINYVSENRGNLGALQNRLEHTVNTNNNTSENMESAKSVIKDTDMASEMMEYTKMGVLVQSAQSMLAQTNQAPQSILELLG